LVFERTSGPRAMAVIHDILDLGSGFRNPASFPAECFLFFWHTRSLHAPLREPLFLLHIGCIHTWESKNHAPSSKKPSETSVPPGCSSSPLSFVLRHTRCAKRRSALASRQRGSWGMSRSCRELTFVCRSFGQRDARRNAIARRGSSKGSAADSTAADFYFLSSLP